MRNFIPKVTPWYIKVMKSINKLLLQLIVLATFLGILPLIILIYIHINRDNYLNALCCCGILLTLIKANQLVQG